MPEKLPRGSRRRWPVGYNPRLERRAKEAEERQARHAGRTSQEQLAELDKRPGRSTRERARLTSNTSSPKETR